MLEMLFEIQKSDHFNSTIFSVMSRGESNPTGSEKISFTTFQNTHV